MAGVLLGTMFAAMGEWRELPWTFLIIGTICLGLWLLGLLIMALVFRGRYRVRYEVSAKGIRPVMADKSARVASRIAIVGGALARSAATAGAGLVAAGRESNELSWAGSLCAVFHDREHRIALRSAWRTLMHVQCLPENYEAVSALTREQMARHATAERVESRPGLRAYLSRTLAAIVASVPLFPLSQEFDTGVFLPILILCVALAMTWLVSLFGWVVIVGLSVQGTLFVSGLLESHESIIRPGTSYRVFEVLGRDDVILIAMFCLGAMALLWLSVQALRGRYRAALTEDAQDTTD